MRIVYLICIVAGVVACAIPKDYSSFAVSSGESEDDPFLSSRQLLVAGLVSESIGLGSRGRFFDAELRLRRALFLDPHNSNIAFNLAVVLAQSGNVEEAREIIDKLRAESPRAPRLMLALADIFNTQGRLREAREALKEALAVYRESGNYPQAALVSRSISNIAYAEGYEQEALCYSLEALHLASDPQQAGYHGGLLVGLNLFEDAKSFLSRSMSVNASTAGNARVLHALALAQYALGDYDDALRIEEQAQAIVASAPELGAEINVVWWLLMQRKQKAENQSMEMTEKLKTQLNGIYPEVLRLQEKSDYRLMFWPASLQEELRQVPRSEE